MLRLCPVCGFSTRLFPQLRSRGFAKSTTHAHFAPPVESARERFRPPCDCHRFHVIGPGIALVVQCDPVLRSGDPSPCPGVLAVAFGPDTPKSEERLVGKACGSTWI